jgi:ADP-ribose pyrophosphatase YjhB (NUDIX family)
MKTHAPTSTPASYLILIKDDQVLLSRRANTGFWDGSYALPAGHVEVEETYTQNLIREAKEEIGIDLDPQLVQVVHIMHRKSDTDGSKRIDTFFKVEKWQGEVENKEPEKCDDLAWFPLNKLPNNIIPYIKLALENMQKGVFYSEFGW